MLLAVAGPARGRSHTSRTGSDSNDVYGYYDHRYFNIYANNTGSAFGSIFDECDVSDYSQEELTGVHYLPLVIYPFLLLQGIVGNLLAIPVLVKISRNVWSSVLYLACLSATDLIILLVRCGDAWYQEVVRASLSRRIIDSSDAACKTYYFAFTCVKHINPWIMVAVSVEMMIATRWPKRTYRMCTLDRTRNVMMLIGIIIVCLDINHFWTYGVPKPGLPCIYMEEFSENFKDWVWPVMDTAIELLLPMCVVSVCFFLTAAPMIQRSADQSKLLDSEMSKYFLELDTLQNFRSVCFLLCLAFLLLDTCKVTYTLTTLASALGYLDIDCSSLDVFKTVDLTLTFTFYSAKIYLYLAASVMFRALLKDRFQRARLRWARCCKGSCCRCCGQAWTPVPAKEQLEPVSQGDQIIDVLPDSSSPGVGIEIASGHSALKGAQGNTGVSHTSQSAADRGVTSHTSGTRRQSAGTRRDNRSELTATNV